MSFEPHVHFMHNKNEEFPSLLFTLPSYYDRLLRKKFTLKNYCKLALHIHKFVGVLKL